MAPRAIWKGHLEIGQLVCPVALHAAASTSERVAFHIVNRKTGHRVRRVFVDAETGETVERDDQAKGHETDRGKMVVVEEEELAEAVPESDKTLRVEAFIPCDEVDTLYFDRPYYLTPDGEAAESAFAVIRAGLAKQKAAAIARTVLFRRLRPVLIRAQQVLQRVLRSETHLEHLDSELAVHDQRGCLIRDHTDTAFCSAEVRAAGQCFRCFSVAEFAGGGISGDDGERRFVFPIVVLCESGRRKGSETEQYQSESDGHGTLLDYVVTMGF